MAGVKVGARMVATLVSADAEGTEALYLGAEALRHETLAAHIGGSFRVRTLTDAQVTEMLPKVQSVYLMPSTGAPVLLLQRQPTDPQAMGHLWTSAQCAEHLGVAPRTWMAYTYRPSQRNPAPAPVMSFQGSPLWVPADVIEYGKNRRPRRAALNDGASKKRTRE